MRCDHHYGNADGVRNVRVTNLRALIIAKRAIDVLPKWIITVAKHFGGYLDAPDGSRIRIAHQEFPYDIGIWSNIVQGMNGGPLTWFWPFSQTSAFSDGLSYETNGFEDDSVIWPPPDPDRMFSRTSVKPQGNPFLYDSPGHTNTDQLEAFQARQQYDLQRREGNEYHIQRREPFHQRYGKSNLPVTEKPINQPGEEAWRNSEGDRLEDFGVDEDVEFYDEDDVPLAELIRRRREAEEN
ncbi:Palmitoyltransferase [Agyrium rufum]|nr:Palmitoyltransferase [Agyrium rufum]